MVNEDILVYENFNRQNHPDWNEEQLGLKSALDIQADEMFNENPDVTFTEEFLRLLLRRTEQWIEEHLPELFEKLKDVFSALLGKIGEWLMNGLEYLGEIISNLF